MYIQTSLIFPSVFFLLCFHFKHVPDSRNTVYSASAGVNSHVYFFIFIWSETLNCGMPSHNTTYCCMYKPAHCGIGCTNHLKIFTIINKGFKHWIKCYHSFLNVVFIFQRNINIEGPIRPMACFQNEPGEIGKKVSSQHDVDIWVAHIIATLGHRWRRAPLHCTPVEVQVPV